MRLSDCHNIDDFRRLAKQRLPWPVFDYIDGAADDEITKTRNTSAFDEVDLVPDVLAGVSDIDTSRQIMGRDSALPLVLSPTALQRAFRLVEPRPASSRRALENGRSRARRTSSAYGSASPASPPIRSRKSQRSPTVRSCSSSMSTRTRG